MAISDSEWLKLKEIVEVLAGMRGDKTKAAIRAGSFNPQETVFALRQLQEQIGLILAEVEELNIVAPTQGQVTAPPTAAEFNGLVADVAAIHQQLTALVNALTA